MTFIRRVAETPAPLAQHGHEKSARHFGNLTIQVATKRGILVENSTTMAKGRALEMPTV